MWKKRKLLWVIISGGILIVVLSLSWLELPWMANHLDLPYQDKGVSPIASHTQVGPIPTSQPVRTQAGVKVLHQAHAPILCAGRKRTSNSMVTGPSFTLEQSLPSLAHLTP